MVGSSPHPRPRCSYAAPVNFLRRVWQMATKVDRNAMVFLRPLRAALVALVGLGILVARSDVRSALPFGVGVLFTAMVDHGGALRNRVAPMVGTGVAITIATGLGGLVSDSTPAHVIVGGFLAVLCGFAGAAGATWMFGGILTLVTFTIFSGAPIQLLAIGQNTAWMAIGSAVLLGSALLMFVAIRLVRPDWQSQETLPEPVGSVWSRAREHLHLRDQYVLHAIRLSIVIMVAIVLEEELAFPHSYWIPMTVAWITRPDLNGTVERVVLRVLGTLLGIAVAGTFIINLQPDDAVSVLMTALAVFIVLVFLVPNYAIAVVGITIFVFFLFDIVGYPVKQMIETRIVSTLMAAALAMIAIHIGPRGEIAPDAGIAGPVPSPEPSPAPDAS